MQACQLAHQGAMRFRAEPEAIIHVESRKTLLAYHQWTVGNHAVVRCSGGVTCGYSDANRRSTMR